MFSTAERWFTPASAISYFPLVHFTVLPLCTPCTQVYTLYSSSSTQLIPTTKKSMSNSSDYWIITLIDLLDLRVYNWLKDFFFLSFSRSRSLSGSGISEFSSTSNIHDDLFINIRDFHCVFCWFGEQYFDYSFLSFGIFDCFCCCRIFICNLLNVV